MNDHKNTLLLLASDLKEIKAVVEEEGGQLYQSWQPENMRKDFQASALNFAHYLTLRRYDLREIQIQLANYGFSSLGRLEGHVMPTLQNVIHNIENMFSDEADYSNHVPVKNNQGQEKLDQNHQEIFGPLPLKRYSHIMVTLPYEASQDQNFVDHLVQNGMEVARINSAHDDAKTWKKMIEHVHTAAKKYQRDICLFFDIAGPKIRIQALYTRLQNPRVHEGDLFFLTAETSLQAFYDHDIVLSCEQKDLIHSLKIGEKVSMDDGEVLGHIDSIYPEGVSVKIDRLAKSKGQKLKATKGINFTERELKLNILTDRDKENLKFIKDYDAILGFSFIHQVEDIYFIQDYLKAIYGKRFTNIPLCVKVETLSGFNHIAEIIVELNRFNQGSIMIARGDLAVEMGYLRLSEVQEELLWLAEAAHTPAIWATQVLESMSKNGIPTRAEITDATMAGRAECVMLNKGEHMVDTVKFLNDILDHQSKHMIKKTALFRALTVAKNAFHSQADN